MNATPTGGIRWQVVEGPDLITVWLDTTGLRTERISNYNNPKKRKHAITNAVPYDDLIPAAEGQKKLL